MGVVGQGSPIQTMQYQALPFEALNYAPQILSQKHEAMQEQYDMMNTIVPNDIPEEARPAVNSYLQELDSAVNDLTRNGYSFESRNKLSSLRRNYNEKIKPIEGFNKLKAEAADIKNKATLNPGIIASITMPSYGDYLKGKTNYDLSVISKDEYQKLGVNLRDQSSQTPFATVVNGAVVSGLKSQFDNMTPDEIRNSILQNPDIKNRLLADGIDPNKEGFNEAISAIVTGVMQKPEYNVAPYTPPKDTGGSKSPYDLNKPPTLIKAGRSVYDVNRIWGTNIEGISDINNMLLDPSLNPSLRQVITEQKNKIANAVSDSKELSEMASKAMSSKPKLSEATVFELRRGGMSEDQIKTLTTNNFTDVGEVNFVISNFMASKDQVEPVEPALIDSRIARIPNSDLRNKYASASGELDQSLNDLRVWYNNTYKPTQEKINSVTDNMQSSVGLYTPTETTAKNNLAVIVNGVINTDDTRVTLGNRIEDGDKEFVTGSKLDKNKVKEDINTMIGNNSIEYVTITEPSADDNIPAMIAIKGKGKDDIPVEYTIRLPDTNETFNLIKTIARQNNQPELESASATYFLKSTMNNNAGRLPLSINDNISNMISPEVAATNIKASDLGIAKDAHIRSTQRGYEVYLGNDVVLNGTTYKRLEDAKNAAQLYIISQYRGLNK